MLTKFKQNIDIITLIVISSLFNIWNLFEQGLGNLYYSAGVSSMRQNIHAFFFNSLDVSGYISIDKPPLGLWIQVISTKIFGFNGMAILLPEAICGVLSVLFLYKMIAKRFGRLAGFLSGLILCITPIFVAVSRNNTIDSILILLLILASEQTIKATQTKNFRHILFAGILLGLGFNVKMLQAYMIVPAVYLTYLIFTDVKLTKRILYTFLSGIIAIIISFSWVIAVDLTPKDKRPFVGSSTTNSELELVFGYNGIGRLFGIGMGKHGGNNNQMPPIGNGENQLSPPMDNDQSSRSRMERPKAQIPPEDNTNQNSKNNNPPEMNSESDVKNMHPMSNSPHGIKNQGGEAGSTSIIRFFNNSISGQISWFIIPSFICVFAYIYMLFKRKTERRNEKSTLLFYLSMCFIPMFIYFSFSSGVAHRYYLAMIAPSIAALSGILFSELIKLKNHLWFISVLSISVILQIYIQNLYQEWFHILIYIVLILLAISIIIIILTKNSRHSERIKTISLVILFILPSIWSLSPIIYGDNSQIPITGPELVNSNNAFSKQMDMSKIISFLAQNRKSEKYLALVSSAMDGGNELIIESSQPVMTIGGFSGGDSSITLQELKEKITNGIVRYAVLKGNKQMQLQNKNAPTNDVNSSAISNNIENDYNITEWIKANCEEVFQDNTGFTVYDLSNYK